MSIEKAVNSQEINKNYLPVNIQEHFRKEQASHPEATGALTSILTDLSRVAKSISYLVNTAGIKDIYGITGEFNVQGEAVLKLDERANEQFKEVLCSNPYVAGFASEEEESFVAFSPNEKGKYVVWFDPLDGSSNFDTNVSIGSIFAIYKRVSDIKDLVDEKDFIQPGCNQVCAGYFLYGASTMLVYTAGNGVYGFTLDPSVGEFVLPESYSRIKIPEKGKIYSVNEGNSGKWNSNVKNYIDYLKTRDEDQCGARYIGSLVADFHRNLLKGGVFIYPEEIGKSEGKLRLNCELNPMSFIVEQAGGMAIDGNNRILDLIPCSLHQRSPVVTGSKREVELFTKF